MAEDAIEHFEKLGGFLVVVGLDAREDLESFVELCLHCLELLCEVVGEWVVAGGGEGR